MDRAALVTLFDYHYWARDRMLDALAGLTQAQYEEALAGSFGSVRDTVVHIYAAEWIWHSRWQGISPTEPLAVERWPDVASLAAEWRELEHRMRQMFTDMPDSDLTREVEYRLLSGAAGKSVFWHMAQHVVNHATYHRGQVTTLLRQLGAPPPASMDLITYYREPATLQLSG
jgi:uncharacterized damage-inducible protein DinB